MRNDSVIAMASIPFGLLGLVPQEDAKSETGQKVATKVAAPPDPEKQNGDRVDATADSSTD